MRFRLPVLKPPTAEARALAGLGGLALDAMLAALLLFFVVDRYAPPQDLFWKPLSLDHPIGMATSRKIATASADPTLCRSVLAAGRVSLTEQPDKRDGFCTNLGAVRIAGGTSPLSPRGPVMTCREALALSIWDRQVLQPAAMRHLKSRVASIEHYGTYACRRVYGRQTGRVSEHAHANAFDFAGVTLADGRKIAVAAHFRAGDERGRFLHAVRDGACRVFRTTLSPDYNAAHRDHLHLDMGGYRICA